MIYTLRLPGRPPSINELTKKAMHWAYAASLKQAWTQKTMVAAKNCGVPRASGKRRVDLIICLGKRRKAADPDAFWKATLDSLVRCGLLADDSDTWCEMGTVTYDGRNGMAGYTDIRLTDLA